MTQTSGQVQYLKLQQYILDLVCINSANVIISLHESESEGSRLFGGWRSGLE